MAKDNPSRSSDPGAAKTNETSKPGNRPKTRDKWRKQHWVSYALEVGIKGAETMTQKEILAKVNKLVKEGHLPNQLGGVRPNSGKKKTVPEQIQFAYELIAEHAMGEVEVLIHDKENPGAPVKVKMTRVEALTAKLYSLGTGGNVHAINSYLDRFAGKPKQSIEHTGEIKVEEQNTPTAAEEAAARAYEEALEKGVAVKSPIQV